MAKIIVIGINYAPEPTGSAPYTSGISEMLAEEGHNVEALVGVPHYPWWQVLKEYRYRLRSKEIRNRVTVRHYRHFVPKQQTVVQRILWEVTFFANVLFSKPLARPDLVICTIPNLSGGLLGVYFSKRFRVPLLTVVQDVVSKAVTGSGLDTAGKTVKIIKRIEELIFISSRIILVPSPKFTQYIANVKNFDGTVLNFPNWTHIREPNCSREEAKNFFGWTTNETIILHSGNMGLKQDLKNVIETAKLMEQKPEFRFVLCGGGNQKQYLMTQAIGMTNVLFMEPVSEEVYPNLLFAADILVVNERHTVGDMSLPSKLTSYFSIGRPIIAAVSPEGACAQEINRTDGAAKLVAPGRPDEFARAIYELSSSQNQLKVMAAAGRQYAKENLTRSAAKLKLINVVNSMISNNKIVSSS